MRRVRLELLPAGATRHGRWKAIIFRGGIGGMGLGRSPAQALQRAEWGRLGLDGEGRPNLVVQGLMRALGLP